MLNDGNNSSAQAHVDQSVNLPDYFSCHNCVAYLWHGKWCDNFQAEGRCAKAALTQALASGAVQIHLYLPAGNR